MRVGVTMVYDVQIRTWSGVNRVIIDSTRDDLLVLEFPNHQITINDGDYSTVVVMP